MMIRSEQADPPQQQGPPSGPPPNFTPKEPPSTFAVDPGAISRCLFRFSYIWLKKRRFVFGLISPLSVENPLRGGVIKEGVGGISE